MRSSLEQLMLFRVIELLTLVFVGWGICAAQGGSKQLITVRDSIEMVRLSNGLSHGGYSPRIAEFSPDGTKFVVILKKGNLEANTNEFTLWLFQVESLFQSPKPEALLTMSTSSSRPGIQNVTWCSDSQSIVFQGETPGKLQQVYLFNTRDKTLLQLTHHPTNVISFSLTPDATTVAYVAEAPVAKLFDDDANKNGLLITDQYLVRLVADEQGEKSAFSDQTDVEDRVFIQNTGETPVALGVPRLNLVRPTPFISPDGKHIVIASTVQAIPNEWREYTAPFLHKLITDKLAPGQYSVLDRYIMLDVLTGQQRLLLNSPLDAGHGASSEVAWSPDSKSVVLGHVFLPLLDSSGQERELRKSTPFTVEVQVPDGTFSKLTHGDIQLLGWEAKTNTLLFQDQATAPSNSSGEIAFKRGSGGWEKLATPAPSQRPIIEDKEDINTPPHLVAVRPGTQRTREILDLNPQFKNLAFAKVEQITYTASDGHRVGGLLYYPLHFQTHRRYPLVIQTHGYEPELFSMNGIGDWAPFAAQQLAAHDIMVLQADTVTDIGDIGTIREAPRGMAIYEGAIDYLDQEKLIDRNHVGIIGFSRTCPYVKYTLTHSNYKFAAAMTVEGFFDGGYFSYIELRPSADFSPLRDEGLNGGSPFGKNLQEWLKRSPGFNIDKVNAPLFIGVPKLQSLIDEWEWFSALRALNKPVEMIVLEKGDHPVHRPWEERVLEEYGTLDWFCFWLKNEEDPDPAKREKYERWQGLRNLQNGDSIASHTSEQ